MTDSDWMERVLLVSIIVFFILLGYAVIKTAEQSRYNVQENQRDRITLVEKCEEFYDNGTSEWKECMGVGLK